MTAMVDTSAQQAALGWRRRLMQQLLYGRKVDRSAKSRARVGLAILAFSLGYAVIGGRLIQLAAAPDIKPCAARRMRSPPRVPISLTAMERSSPPT